MRHKYIYFDVAGTLLYKNGLYEGIRKTLEEHGYELLLTDIIRNHRLLSDTTSFPVKTEKGFYMDFNRKLLLSLGVIPEVNIIDAIFESCSGLSWKPYDDVDVLAKISCPKGILSNWDDSLQDVLEKCLPYSFDTVLSSHQEGLGKPDVAFYKKAVEDAGCDAAEILFVGDSIALDYVPAAKTGIDVVLIDRDSYYRSFPGKKMRSLGEVCELE